MHLLRSKQKNIYICQNSQTYLSYNFYSLPSQIFAFFSSEAHQNLAVYLWQYTKFWQIHTDMPLLKIIHKWK